MKFTCRTEHLKNALGMLARVVPAKPAKDILKAVKLETVSATSSTGVTIQGNDGENALQMVLVCPVQEPGEGLLEFSKLRPIVESFVEGETTIELGESSAKIISGNSKFTLGCGRTAEYPSFPKHEFTSKLQINSGEWVNAISRLEPFSVPPAACNWRGVHIESDDKNGVYAAATNADSGVLGWEKLDAHLDGPDISALISERGSKLMAAVLQGHPGDCHILFSNAMVSVSVPQGTAICRLNEGKFPPWRKVKDNHKAKFDSVFPRDTMIVALGQATIPLTDASRRLNFKFSDNTLILSAMVAGDESEVKMVFPWEDEELELTYSGDTVRNVIQAFPQGAQVNMFLIEDGAPMRLESGAIGFCVAGMERQ